MSVPTAGTSNTSGQVGGAYGRINGSGEATLPDAAGEASSDNVDTSGGLSSAQQPADSAGTQFNAPIDMGLESDEGVDEMDASLSPPACMPVSERCDNIDNDCDQMVDEDFDFTTDSLHCGECNRECQPQNAVGQCEDGACRVGECNAGFVDLNGMFDDGCECVQQNGGNELCNRLDEDCDGRIDETFNRQADPENCGQCGVICALNQAMAACQLGQCIIAGCNAGFGDANGVADDGCECVFQNEGNDICNQVDDDCDGQADEDFNLETDPNHCGACNTACSITNALALCVDGRCALESCLPGFVDLNGLTGDGCECQQSNDGVELCNQSDDDCDGRIDESFDIGVACSAGIGACRESGQKICSADGDNTECSVNGRAGTNEACNTIDDDCDGMIDEGFDGDDDGFKTCIDGIDCGQPCPAEVDCGVCSRSDCRDGDPDINPDAAEICGDMIDQNCDGRDAPCLVPVSRMGTLAVVLPQNSGVCSDLNGDGRPDNRLGTVSPGLVNSLIGPSFREGAANSVNLMFLFYGVDDSSVDMVFELATVNAQRVGNRYVVLNASIDNETGRPVNEFPGSRLTNGILSAGPRQFVLRLPLGDGSEVALNTRDAVVRGTITVPAERNGRTGGRIRNGILTAAIEKATLVQALRAADQDLIALALNFVAPDLDKDDEPGNESISLCLEFTAEPPAFEVNGIPQRNGQ